MFRWCRVLALALLVASLVPASSPAYPIRVNFTVQGAPEDPVLAGVISSGYFVFDSSLIPYGGGTISANAWPGLVVSAVSFVWDGHLWTEADAFCGILTFSGETLVGWNLQALITPNSVVGGTTDFAFDIHPSGNSTFSYAAARSPGVYAGTVVSWDVATVPIIVGAWGDGVVQLTLDSFGRVYSYSQVGCPGQLGTVAIIGNLFNGPPPSRVVSMASYTNIIFATLENGDVWQLCSGANSGTLVGNIFSAPGIAAVGSDTPRTRNALSNPRPNPFNPATEIPYKLASGGRVVIRVFDVGGRLIRTVEDRSRHAGDYVVRWDGQTDGGSAAASGTYFARITYPDGSAAERKMTILR